MIAAFSLFNARFGLLYSRTEKAIIWHLHSHRKHCKRNKLLEPTFGKLKYFFSQWRYVSPSPHSLLFLTSIKQISNLVLHTS